MYHGKRHCFPLGKVEYAEAEAKPNQVDYLLLRIKQGFLQIPTSMDIITFLQFDGKPPEHAPPHRGEITPGTLREEYPKVHRGSEDTTPTSMTIHFKHLVGSLGERVPIPRLTLADLQRHATRRREMTFRGQKIGPVTIRKELVTLRTAWSWAVHMGYLSDPFPPIKRGKLGKTEQKPPFHTYEEVERKIALGGLSVNQIDDLWDSLYLRATEVEELLAHVKKQATVPWLHPLCCTAAWTGARKSELIRMEIGDVDFVGGTVMIRERKQREKTTRWVPLIPALKNVLQQWLKVHPAGRFLFCQPGVLARSKIRSLTTGHQGEKTRATTLKGRLASVTQREQPALGLLTPKEVHDHLRRTLRGSRWEVVRGLHTLRHGFISCLASAGVDQRIIDDAVGHQTEEQRRRCRHLYPEVKRDEIARAFSQGGNKPSR